MKHIRFPETDDVEAQVAWLRAGYAESLSAGNGRWSAGEAAVAEGRLKSADLAELALSALQGMAPGDPVSWGMVASAVLMRHGRAEQAERLRDILPGLPARTALRDWRHEARFALALLEARDAACDCAVHAAHGRPIPGPRWRRDGERIDAEAWITEYAVTCARCTRRWTVTERSSYHYPTYSWSKRR